jgi:hypothetical protein
MQSLIIYVAKFVAIVSQVQQSRSLLLLSAAVSTSPPVGRGYSYCSLYWLTSQGLYHPMYSSTNHLQLSVIVLCLYHGARDLPSDAIVDIIVTRACICRAAACLSPNVVEWPARTLIYFIVGSLVCAASSQPSIVHLSSRNIVTLTFYAHTIQAKSRIARWVTSHITTRRYMVSDMCYIRS